VLFRRTTLMVHHDSAIVFLVDAKLRGDEFLLITP
jgi:hypothetical protein